MPTVSGAQLVKFFQERGFRKDRQNGSHIILTKDGIARPLVIPNHKEPSIGAINSNLKTAGISKQDFIEAIQNPKRKPQI